MELYVGVDDSNHAGDRKGDIILATFATDSVHSTVQNWGKGRDSFYVQKLLDAGEIDYRFSVLWDKELRRIQSNLPLVTPLLIEDFFKENVFPEKLKVYFDGQLRKWHKELIKEHFEEIIPPEDVIVDNFIKHQGVHNCPGVVYYSDVLSNQIYNRIFDGILQDPKRIEVNESKILERLILK